MSLKEILYRRSIRKYTPELVSDEDMEELLRAAMAAPSAGNAQPWYFVILTERRLLEAIADFHPYAAMARHAPAAILVCGDPSLEKYPGFWVQDLSAAVENLLLAAQSKGLGAVWVGIYPTEERVEKMRELLAIPPNIIPFALVPFGHPAETKPPAERFNPARVFRNGWSG
ncbi:Nitroreductase [Geoalkalibacter ferrihydriticus]|uniref:NADH dehydrogenase n=2 Tax=Geoalkalibacter ferrihydriticus TaxID=392333 RepID=A0A0C2HHM2_9BACT|nr:nitroreductase family protein [Geoalkalibacter ferrihydriticus]KIH76496.1 NADH dehydrogenase [Geoalkalibacter ferrihydriticus DSM 17813]SDL98324.1 Nitroreductase [Geoalkalibacter ferrihydriticus]